MNCTCENVVLTLAMGVERCATCGKVAGSSAFVPYGQPLPPRPRQRKRVFADHPARTRIATSAVREASSLVTTDAPTDEASLIALWLHGRSRHTIRAYSGDATRFLAFVGKPLRAVTLGDLQAFADGLQGAESSRGRVLASVKSLLSFAARLGAVPFNVGAALQKVRARDTLADRILSETEVNRMLVLTDRATTPWSGSLRWRIASV